jgi:DNA (cytosine-5)-methyltransferase 1
MKIRIGTDCSGIDAPIQALLQLGIDHEHVFSCEIDKYCIKTLKANYDIPLIFDDISKRNIEDVPDIDIYVAGFPCQSFSQAGMRKGLDDTRGTIFHNCISLIKTKKPKYFILENVKNILTHNKGATWKVIEANLSHLKEIGYDVSHRVLNTRDHGIPQNRERVFIVGRRDEKDSFVWPEKDERCQPLTDFIDYTNKTSQKWNRKTDITSVKDGAVFVDVDFLHYTSYPNAHLYSPCVVARGSSLWCVPYHRYATPVELGMLQGFPKDFKQVVSDTQMKKQYGNSMSVNVLKKLITQLLKK